MGQPDTATQRSAAPGVLSTTFPPIGNVLETQPSGFNAACANETLKWSELTYLGRTFVFNRELVICVLKEDGGWAFESADPKLMGFGHTRPDAELSFCFGFALNWDQIACENDEKLTLDAIDLKRALLSLVKAQK